MNKMSSKKWFVSFICICLTVLLLMALTIYLFDPFCYYRIPENRLIVNSYRFLNAGIAKNATYDTVMIGSSMTQNFNMNSFRNKLGLNPVKLSVAGMSLEGLDLTYSQVCRIGKSKNAFICIDLPSLEKSDESLDSYATYLYNASIWDDYKYLLGYETWMRLFPLNVGIDLFSKTGRELPRFYGTYDIDTIGEWDHDAIYSAENIKNNYLRQIDQITVPNLIGIQERMRKNVDVLLDIIGQNPEQKVTLFFPPYSALMWYNSQKQGYYEVYQDIKKYIVESVSDNSNIQIYDFQCMPIINNLDNYKDVTHYSAKINEMMVDCFLTGEYKIDKDTVLTSINKLGLLIEEFEANNTAWLEQDVAE